MSTPKPPPWPRAVRRAARRCRASLLALRTSLAEVSPDAEALACDPSLAERITTHEHDLEAAEVVATACRLLKELDWLE